MERLHGIECCSREQDHYDRTKYHYRYRGYTIRIYDEDTQTTTGCGVTKNSERLINLIVRYCRFRLQLRDNARNYVYRKRYPLYMRVRNESRPFTKTEHITAMFLSRLEKLIQKYL